MPPRKKRVQPKKKDEQSSDSDESSPPPPKSVTKPVEQPKKKAALPAQAKKSTPVKNTPQKKKAAPASSKKEKPSEVQEKKPRAPRKKVTMENYLEKCDELLGLLDEEVTRKQKAGEKGTRVFRSIRKTVRELKTDAPKLANTRRKTYSGEKRVSGLELKCEITDDLADFMGVERGTTPSRNDITNAICAYIHLRSDEQRPQVLNWAHLNPEGKRNLQNPQDRMKIIPDDRLGKLLGYEQYKKDVADGKVKETVTNKKTRKRENVVVTDPALKYYVVQRLIRDQIIGTFKMEKPSDEVEQ